MAADGRSSAALSPEAALAQGHWGKLICGASNQDLPAITDLCTVFGAAGVHCIDVAADPAVVAAARAGFDFFGAAFKLPISQDRKANTAVHHVTVVDANTLAGGSRIEIIRMVCTIRDMDRIHHSSWFTIAPF